MNLNLVVSNKNVDIKGKLNSNKQPLEIKAEYSKNKNNNIKTSVDFDSLAFNGDIKINGNTEKKEYTIKLEVVDPAENKGSSTRKITVLPNANTKKAINNARIGKGLSKEFKTVDEVINTLNT